MLEYVLTYKIGVNILKYLNLKDVFNSSATSKVLRNKLFTHALDNYTFNEGIIEFYYDRVKKLCTKDLSIINKFTSLTHLTFGLYFNQELNDLPQNLVHLEFRLYFNQELNDLPQSITHLAFGYYFNQKVDKNNLPQNLIHLEFGYYFYQKIDSLPLNLKSLTVNIAYEEDI